MDVLTESLAGHDITALGPYRPWWFHKQQGGDATNWPTHSGLVLDAKESKPFAISYFTNYLSPRIKNSTAVTVVPSHDPENLSSGVRTLAGQLAANGGLVDASPCLVRHTKIVKLADGGDRRISVHLQSIRVDNADLIAGKIVLLIDDIMTTGHSLLAARQLLMEAGAADVKCVALGRTTY